MEQTCESVCLELRQLSCVLVKPVKPNNPDGASDAFRTFPSMKGLINKMKVLPVCGLVSVLEFFSLSYELRVICELSDLSLLSVGAK